MQEHCSSAKGPEVLMAVHMLITHMESAHHQQQLDVDSSTAHLVHYYRHSLALSIKTLQSLIPQIAALTYTSNAVFPLCSILHSGSE